MSVRFGQEIQALPRQVREIDLWKERQLPAVDALDSIDDSVCFVAEHALSLYFGLRFSALRTINCYRDISVKRRFLRTFAQ